MSFEVLFHLQSIEEGLHAIYLVIVPFLELLHDELDVLWVVWTVSLSTHGDFVEDSLLINRREVVHVCVLEDPHVDCGRVGHNGEQALRVIDIIILCVDHCLIAANRIVPIQGIQTEEVPLHLAVILEGDNDPPSKEIASRQLRERHKVQVL